MPRTPTQSTGSPRRCPPRDDKLGTREGGNRVDWRDVDRVVDLWEVDTEWWTAEPVRRRYWRLALSDGGLVTVYRDLITGHWFRQGY